MKKINSKTIIILAIVLALLVSLVASASAAYTRDASAATVGYATDDGYVTNDSLVYSRPSTGYDIHIRDLFVTGGIGTAESTGVLTKPVSKRAYDDQAHWTLKDGVLVIDGPSDSDVVTGVSSTSPFWNNPYIETVVIGANIHSIDGVKDGALFYFGLPNLKTVIFLGDTIFNPRYDDSLFGDFPTDHQVNYVWASMNNGVSKSRAAYAYGKPGVGTSNDIADFASANDKNSFFADRSAWLTAAAPVLASAKLNQAAIDLMPADMVSAVNAIGGFKNTADGTSTQAPVADTQPVTPSAPASDGISVTVNGKAVVWTDAEPFIDANSRTMVPLRAVADAMGLTVNWSAQYQRASFNRDGYGYIAFDIGDKYASTFKFADNDAGAIFYDVEMDTVPVIVNDRTYAPIRYLAEFFNYTVGWDAATRTVTITG